MTEIWKKRLEEALEKKKISMKDASLAAGKNETFVRDILKRDRTPSIENFIDIANFIGMPVSYLLGEDLEAQAEVQGMRRVEVAAHVQAGLWSETWEWPDDDKYPIFVPDLAEHRGIKLYAAEVRGPSMNKRYPEGTVVVFNNIDFAREQPMAGKRYVVERRRATGEMEHTVKLLHADTEGGLWLMPESDDPRFQSPISVSDGTNDGDTVVIVGRVLFSVNRE